MFLSRLFPFEIYNLIYQYVCSNKYISKLEIVIGLSRVFLYINPANLSCRIFRKSGYRAMFSNFHQKDRITIFLFLSLYVAGERRIKGELSQNQNNSIDRVAYYKRDEYFCALGCQNISCYPRKYCQRIIVLYFCLSQNYLISFVCILLY